jgi:hypothetical protein
VERLAMSAIVPPAAVIPCATTAVAPPIRCGRCSMRYDGRGALIRRDILRRG